MCLLVAAGAAKGQGELESCHCSLPSQAVSHLALSQGEGEQRAGTDSISRSEEHRGGGGLAEQSCSFTSRGWGWATKSGLESSEP